MTESEAENKVKQLYGPLAHVFDRDAQKMCRSGALPRFYVGTGSTHYGNGETWEQAFVNVREYDFLETDEL